jgi:Arc/MetJ-type ribon-helix-helix transcriptional regulator
LKLVTFLLPEAYLEGLDRLVELRRFQSRSEAVRFAVKEMIKRELWRAKAEKVLASKIRV